MQKIEPDISVVITDAAPAKRAYLGRPILRKAGVDELETVRLAIREDAAKKRLYVKFEDGNDYDRKLSVTGGELKVSIQRSSLPAGRYVFVGLKDGFMEFKKARK